MPRPKILVVDDSDVDAGMIRRYLASEDANEYHVLAAQTGEEGLDAAATFSPDVILLDFELPDMDGLEFLSELHGRLPKDDLPVVLAVTGQRDPRIAAELIRGGAEDYISKGEATPESVRLAVRQAARTKTLRAALAERARERERSQEALVASLRRASYVASFSEALSRSLSTQDVLNAVSDLAVPSLAAVCIVDVLEYGTLVRRSLRASDALKALETATQTLASPLDAAEGSAKVLRSAAPAAYAKSWLQTLARWDRDVAAALRLAPLESAIIVPMLFDAAPIGTVTLLFLEPFDAYTQDVANELGRRAAAALTNARTFEAERSAKRASEDARRRLDVLSKISELFSRSLEWRETVREMIRIVVPAIADYAAMSLAEDGQMYLVASSGETVSNARSALTARATPQRSEYYPDLNLMRRYNDAERTLHALQDASDGSFVRVPIIAPAGTALGELAVSTNGDRRLSRDDLGLAEDIGRRVGMYIETAQAFERERNIARGLQKSLLPADIPLLPGVQFAARCIAGVSGVGVGGDWYDIIPLRDGYVAFAVGDVAGRGVLAAAVMGQLRSSLRAYVLEGLGPAEALVRLNAFMLSQEHMEFATVVLGVLHTASGSVRLSSAGHLPPLFIDAAVGARTLQLHPALPVGIVTDPQFSEESMILKKGQTLAFFTDGLVESHSRDVEYGTGELVRILAQPASPDDLLTRALELVPAEPTDDVTFLALRYLGIGAQVTDGAVPGVLLTLPAVPQSAGRVREHLQDFCERVGLHGSRRFDLQLAVGEAVANAVEHAYDGAHDAVFSVHARAEDEKVLVDVLDQGRWREGVRTPRGQLSERGRGVSLMRALCDQVRIERTLVGTRIQFSLSMVHTDADDIFA